MSDQPTFNSWETLKTQLNDVTAQKTQSATLPPACYSDPVFYAQEVETFFHRGWVGIGRCDRWEKSGDYTAMDIGGVPVIIVRSSSGELKGFANSCRHRGSLMLKGSGTCKTIRCPFHCWTYDVNGNLVYSPKMENAENFDPADYGLIEFRVESLDGFGFICLDDKTEGLESWLGDFSSLHAPWELENLKSTRLREFEVNCNWKTFIEVFNEYYHLPYVHPASLNWLYPEPDDVDQVTGQYTTQFGETEGNAALMAETQDQALPVAKHLTGRELKGTRYTWAYPNMTFAISPDSMWMYQAYPISPDRCRVEQTICFPVDTINTEDFDSRVKHYYDRYDAALDEDIPFLEQQQIGLNSKFAQPGRFSSLEPSVANFAYWYADKLSASLS